LVGSTTGNASSRQAYFDLNTGITAGLVNATSTITAVGNGWYRCSITFVSTAEASYRFAVWLLSNDIGATYTGNGYSGIFIWGAQLEVGAFPTSYIPTVASQVTRSADGASMTGANFNSWYRADEGTVFIESGQYVTGRTDAAFVAAEISDNTSSNILQIGTQFGLSNFQSLVNYNGVSQVVFLTISVTAQTKRSFAYKFNDFAQSISGSAVLTDTSGNFPVSMTRFDIGKTRAGTNYLNGHIRKLSYYPLRCTNAQLQALTS
jgi:hypothetical protein